MFAMIFAVAMQTAAALAPTGTQAVAASTVQQMFDQAASQRAAGDTPAALATLDAVEKRLGPKANPRTRDIVRLQRGTWLAEIGQDEPADELIAASLAALPADDPSLKVLRYDALMAWGAAAERALDYALARGRYAGAVAYAELSIERAAALAASARVKLFDDPAASLADADAALKAVASEGDVPAARLGAYRTLKGRALLNLGRFAEARTELAQATKELGGLTMRATLADISVRSDLALAALLAGDTEDARRYLAYTGAGRLRGKGVTVPADMQAPPCDAKDGLRPDDVAVVEFALGENGAVTGVAPVYASRGPAALLFARAVAGWSWRPEEAGRIEPFFRSLVRVELRCSIASERPGMTMVAANALDQWLRTAGVIDVAAAAEGEARAEPALRAELARREAAFGAADRALLPVLVRLGANSVVPNAQAVAFYDRASAIARGAQAPPLAIAYVEIVRAMRLRGMRHGQGAAILLPMLDDPVIASDAQARAALALAIADDSRRRQLKADVLRGVIDDKRLDQRDPLRVGALVRAAALSAEAGDLETARGQYQQTGLTAQQCALVDASPSLRRSNATSSDFPMEAMRWGFEGWARTEFDIDAQGRTANVRAIITYPAFVFGTAAADILKGARFDQSYRPEGGLGCGGQQQVVRFSLPDR